MVMPFGKFGFPGNVPVTGRRFRDTASWNPNNGPKGMPSIPGGKLLCERKPTARVDIASWLFEKKSAVRAFCTATSHENMVASPTRKVPSTAGASRSLSGLLTTAMNTFADVPSGRRMPARVMAARWAAFAMISVTSVAVRRLAPPMNCLPGTVEIGSSMK